jgi:hypothetical protein
MDKWTRIKFLLDKFEIILEGLRVKVFFRIKTLKNLTIKLITKLQLNLLCNFYLHCRIVQHYF